MNIKKYIKNSFEKISICIISLFIIINTLHISVYAKMIISEKRTSNQQIEVLSSNGLTTIMGQGVLNRDKMILSLINRNKSMSVEDIAQFVDLTISEANYEGVKYDIAFSQMMLETNFLNFGGDVKVNQNNFGGLGATGNGNPGESFPSVQIGIRAVIQHLKAYASELPLNGACVDNRFKYVTRNSAIYVEYLGIQENPNKVGWAAGQYYGNKILNVYNNINLLNISTSKLIMKSVTGEMKVGKPITISATATPSEDSLYRIWVRDNGIWKNISDYSSKSSITYTPQYGGDFVVQIDVKNKNSATTTYDDAWSAIYPLNTDKAKITKKSVTGEMKVGKPITISATATPSEDSLYRIWVRDNEIWKNISDYSSKSSVTYTPQYGGDFVVQIDVKSKYSNTSTYDDAWSAIYPISTDKAKITNKSVTGEMKVGKPITISATATPSEDSLYRIWVRDNGIWKNISDYSSKSSVTYTPQYGGDFVVQIDVKSKYSNTSTYDDAWSAIYPISTDKAKITKKSVTGEMKVGKPITISATATPSEDSLYRIWVRDNGIWKNISDYSSKSSVTYTPQYGGDFVVQIDVKSKYSNTSTYDDAWSAIYPISTDKAKITNKSVTGEMKVGKPITISATATPSGDSLYRIWVRDNGIWKNISDYSSKSSVTYTPQYGGDFVVQIDVKSKYSNTSTYDDAWSKIYPISVERIVLESVDVSGYINSGRNMILKAKSSDDSNALFRFWIRENGDWRLVSDFSTTSTITYMPKYKGPYVYQVEVKHKLSNSGYDDAKSEFLYSTKKDLTIVIDPGHGLDDGKFDPGAQAQFSGINYRESVLNLSIALKLYNELTNKGYYVLMTRTTETNGYNFQDRPMFANNSNADLYISIHNNAATAAARGTEVLYSSNAIDSKILNQVISSGLPNPTKTSASRLTESKKLATLVADELSRSVGFINRGAKDQNLYVCRNTIMPAILIECGFLTNETEAKKLADESTQITMSRVIANTIDDYLEY